MISYFYKYARNQYLGNILIILYARNQYLGNILIILYARNQYKWLLCGHQNCHANQNTKEWERWKPIPIFQFVPFGFDISP